MVEPRARHRSPIYPGGPAAQYDPVRQRVAYCLSQIFVVSDRPETLAVEYRGMANYYDMLVRNALGNFRTLLFDVATHPVMGFYLSHVKNKKANPATNTFPDENFAREVMQLFSIGLWELNRTARGSSIRDGQPIPTYTNATSRNFARVFTGLSYGPASKRISTSIRIRRNGSSRCAARCLSRSGPEDPAQRHHPARPHRQQLPTTAPRRCSM